ncbi:M48 family metalloprotease [bacterium]|nr:M48 family metalloprotease [bacterium]
MNISRNPGLARLSPLASRPAGCKAPDPQQPQLPDQNGDKASVSTRVKIGAGVMLGLTLAGVAGGLLAHAPQAQVQLQNIPSQTWLSTSDEVELGKQASAQLEKEFKVWNNPQQQARLEALGQRLASTSTRQDIQFSFKMLDTDMVNAMALPGGNVYATRALMQKFPDDDQLAFVLGHEIAHVEQRHSVAKLQETVLRKVVTLPLVFRQWNISKVALDAGDELIGNRYSQVKESEADKLGQEHIARMGIDPDKAADAMKHLMDVTAGKHQIPIKIEQIISDHPPTQQRINDLHHWAAEIRARQ